MNLADSVLLKRLLPHLPDPFKILGIPRNTNFDKVEPQIQFIKDNWSEDRTEAYSRGRIRYFRDQFLTGEAVPPIELDNRWGRYAPYGLVLEDGHHRLCGAILAASDHVVASYSGEVEALRWLKGERSSPPEWLGG